MPGDALSTCTRCGEDNPARARFCLACGSPIGSPVGTTGTRRTVTVVFADVVGSTALGETTDPESVREMLLRYFSVASGVLAAHGGTVEKFIGDAVMAVLGCLCCTRTMRSGPPGPLPRSVTPLCRSRPSCSRPTEGRCASGWVSRPAR